MDMDTLILFGLAAIALIIVAILLVIAISLMWKFMHPIAKSYIWWFVRFLIVCPIIIFLLLVFTTGMEEYIAWMFIVIAVAGVWQIFWIPISYYIVQNLNEERTKQGLPLYKDIWAAAPWNAT